MLLKASDRTLKANVSLIGAKKLIHQYAGHNVLPFPLEYDIHNSVKAACTGF